MYSQNGERCCHCISILFPVGKGKKNFYICDISFFEGDRNDTIIHFLDKKETARITIGLSELEQYLEDNLERCDFFRCHNSYIVRKKYVERYDDGKGGYMVMRDENTVSISAKYKNYSIDRMEGRKSVSPTFPDKQQDDN